MAQELQAHLFDETPYVAVADHLKCDTEVRSNPRRMRTLGNVLINLGFAETDELFVLRARLDLVQGNLDNDRAILDAAIGDRFPKPELTLVDETTRQAS